MVWYKAWKETRWRFFVCLALLLLPAYNFLVWRKFLLPGEADGPSVYFKALFNNHIVAGVIWVFSAISLGLGGLLRERAVGSSSFTLTLPVSRTGIAAVRVTVGILEALILAVAPWLVNFGISVFRRTPFSFSQAACCVLLLVGGGMVYFALAVLISSVVEGEYTAAAASYGLVILSLVPADNDGVLKTLNLLTLVTGVDHINKNTFLFSEPLPWATILGSFSIAALMVLGSIAITQRRDF